jgi:hypothetical protein
MSNPSDFPAPVAVAPQPAVAPQSAVGSPAASQAVRMPQHIQLTQAGLPREFAEKIRLATSSGKGYMIALWEMDEAAQPDQPLPSYRVSRTRRGYPPELLLGSVRLLLQDVITHDVLGGNVQQAPAGPPQPQPAQPQATEPSPSTPQSQPVQRPPQDPSNVQPVI